MQLHRFYLPQSIQETTITVTDERHLHQWRNVLRAKEGYELMLFDGSGWEYDARIDELAPDHATLTITDQRSVEPIRPALWLYVGLIKRDKFEWVLEKATELGVAGIVPLDCERSDKKSLKYDRARKIIVEAAEQSGRAWLPEIGAIGRIEEVTWRSDLQVANAVTLDRAGDMHGESLRHHYPDQLSVFIGPEGGWSERERAQFKSAGIQAVSLGDQNLKTETAAVSAAALVLL